MHLSADLFTLMANNYLRNNCIKVKYSDIEKVIDYALYKRLTKILAQNKIHECYYIY